MTGTGEGQHGNQRLGERMEAVRKEESGEGPGGSTSCSGRTETLHGSAL